MAAYPKPFKDIPALLQILQQRGMAISDAAKAARCLDRIGYYRLSGYWHPMLASTPGQTPQDPTIIHEHFRAGTDFSQVADLYVFDKKLRLLMLDAIERVEVSLKVQIARILGQRDPLAHLNPAELHGNFMRKKGTGPTDHERWINKFRQCETRSKEDFIKPFLSQHPGFEFPIWMAVEIWDFGALSHFLAGMKIQDQASLSSNFQVPRPELLTSWVRCFHTVRNTCAHHSRLWNRPIPDRPKPPKLGENPLLDHLADDAHAQTRIYGVAASLQFLIRVLHPGSEWADRLKEHMRSLPQAPNVSLQTGAGFPANWETLNLWN